MAPAGIGRSVEGIHAVGAAVAAGRVERLIVESRRLEREGVAEVVDAARRRSVAVDVIDDVRDVAETTAPQGVVAHCRPLATHSIEALVGQTHPAALLVVDHVEDPHNLGAIVRSAVAAGVPRVVVSDRRSARIGGAAFKAAAGAMERVSLCVVGSVADAVKRLKQLEVWTVGLDAGGDSSLFGLDLLTEPVAIVVGAETGLHRLVRDRVDVVASIPMEPGNESLNASVAAALAVFEIGRVRSAG